MWKCEFDRAWIGPCGSQHNSQVETTTGKVFCDKHLGLKCVSCKQQATHECPETLSLVCGYPLCDNCHHIFDGFKSKGHGPIMVDKGYELITVWAGKTCQRGEYNITAIFTHEEDAEAYVDKKGYVLDRTAIKINDECFLLDKNFVTAVPMNREKQKELFNITNKELVNKAKSKLSAEEWRAIEASFSQK